ncbi:MAG: hypothetical protein HXX13_17285 [Bacteroidetes bacterium]|nr:hypothetical protein [Bacteroidota bacterium]
MKRTLFTIILLAFIPMTSFCQEVKNHLPGKLRLGIQFSPNYCYRSLKSTDSNGSSLISFRNNNEIPKISFRTGIAGILDLNSRLSIRSGLLFSNYGYNGRSSDLVYQDSLYVDTPIPVSFRQNEAFLYMIIPAKIDYCLLYGKLKFFISAGIETNILLTNRKKSFIGYEDGTSSISINTTRTYFHNIAFSVAGSAGIEYRIGQQLGLRVEPEYQRFITSMTNTPIKGYLYSAGLNLSLLYRL